MTKQQRKYIINILLLVSVTAIALFFVLKNDAKAIFAALSKANPWFILLALGFVTLNFCIEGLILKVFARFYVRKYPWYKGVFNGLIGKFFSGITPSASGGQFVQAYTFSKQGVKVTNSASILFMHFIVYQICLVGYGLLALLLKFNEMRSITMVINIWGLKLDIISLSLIGFVVNSMVIVGLFFLAFSRRAHHFIVNTVIGLLSKLHILKHPEKTRQDINTKVETFRIEFKRLTTNWPTLLLVMALMLIQMTLNYSIPYIMGLALHVDMTRSIFDGICMASFVNMVTAMVPIPGASGGAEFVFMNMFINYFDGTVATVNAINLLWRGATFYYGLICGGLVFIFYHESPKEDAIKADSRTMIDLELINIELNKGQSEGNQTPIIKKNKVKEEAVVTQPSTESVEEHIRRLKEDLKEQLEMNEKASLGLDSDEDKKEEIK